MDPIGLLALVAIVNHDLGWVQMREQTRPKALAVVEVDVTQVAVLYGKEKLIKFST